MRPRVVPADLDDFAHELVAEHVALLHRRDIAVVDVQVGSADRRRRHLDDRVARIEDDRIGNGLDPDRFFAFPADGSHGWLLCGGRRSRHLAGFEQLLEVPEILADGLRRLAAEERGDERSSLPAGGAYCRCTLTCVLRPPRTASKFTEPAVTTSDPGSERHAISLFSTSLMISASHSTASPAGPAATQCDLPSEAPSPGRDAS